MDRDATYGSGAASTPDLKDLLTMLRNSSADPHEDVELVEKDQEVFCAGGGSCTAASAAEGAKPGTHRGLKHSHSHVGDPVSLNARDHSTDPLCLLLPKQAHPGPPCPEASRQRCLSQDARDQDHIHPVSCEQCMSAMQIQQAEPSFGQEDSTTVVSAENPVFCAQASAATEGKELVSSAYNAHMERMLAARVRMGTGVMEIPAPHPRRHVVHCTHPCAVTSVRHKWQRRSADHSSSPSSASPVASCQSSPRPHASTTQASGLSAPSNVGVQVISNHSSYSSHVSQAVASSQYSTVQNSSLSPTNTVGSVKKAPCASLLAEGFAPGTSAQPVHVTRLSTSRAAAAATAAGQQILSKRHSMSGPLPPQNRVEPSSGVRSQKRRVSEPSQQSCSPLVEALRALHPATAPEIGVDQDSNPMQQQLQLPQRQQNVVHRKPSLTIPQHVSVGRPAVHSGQSLPIQMQQQTRQLAVSQPFVRSKLPLQAPAQQQPQYLECSISPSTAPTYSRFVPSSRSVPATVATSCVDGCHACAAAHSGSNHTLNGHSATQFARPQTLPRIGPADWTQHNAEFELAANKAVHSPQAQSSACMYGCCNTHTVWDDAKKMPPPEPRTGRPSSLLCRPESAQRNPGERMAPLQAASSRHEVCNLQQGQPEVPGAYSSQSGASGLELRSYHHTTELMQGQLSTFGPVQAHTVEASKPGVVQHVMLPQSPQLFGNHDKKRSFSVFESQERELE